LPRLSRRPSVLLGLAGGLAALAAPVLQASAATTALPHVTPYSPTGVYAEGGLLVNGRLVNPPKPRTALGDFPVALALSPDGRTGVVVNSGEGEGLPQQGDESLQVIDVATAKVVQTVRDHEQGVPTFYNAGVVWSPDGKHVYATGGGNDQVYDYAVTGQQLALKHRYKSSQLISTPVVDGSGFGGVPSSAPLVGDVGAYSRGLTITADGSTLVVTNEQGSTVAGLSTATGAVLWETRLAGAGQAAGSYPGSVALFGNRALVTEQGLNTVAVVDVATGALLGRTNVGDHPTAVAVTRNSHFAFVTNANDDSVSILDLTTIVPTQVRQLSAHLATGEANGSTPNSVAIDSAQSLVYVTYAGDNAVAVFGAGLQRGPNSWNPAAFHQLGAIPTGDYPTGVAVQPATGRVLAVAGKGLTSFAVTNEQQYDGNDLKGLLTTVPRPTAAQLQAFTTTARNGLLHPTKANAKRPAGSPVPDAAHAGQSPIKHVVYVVRENRTFDQVFGDLKRPDADVQPAFVEFGEKDAQGRTVTPNVHALARRFALSQNFYSDGEASIQGHHWTAEGVSSDYVEKSWVHYYSDRNHPYDPTAAITYPRCGAVFQQLARQGKTFRNFGELTGLSTAQTPTATVAPGSRCGTPGGTFDPASLANFSNEFGGNLSLTAVDDTEKEAQFEREYAPLAAVGQAPQFSYVLLGNDHTDGTEEGKKTPQAHVATNDLAVGRLVDFLSHSKDWASTMVVVVEDDSQDGMDHRDGHRNIGLIASPWVKSGMLSSLHISQVSMLRTIELVLGLAPISSYTQYATVPYEMFRNTPDPRPYDAITPTYPLDAKNGAPAPGSAAAVPVDTSQIDVAGPVLEAQIWEATRPDEALPAAMLPELARRGGIRQDALSAWGRGADCACSPLRDGLTEAPSYPDADG